MRLFLFVVCFSVISAAEARIGETPFQFANRYGAPQDTSFARILDKNSPVVEGALHHTYEYEGWKIRAAFLKLDGPAVRMDFQKMDGARNGLNIQDSELEAIKTVNTPLNMTWSPINPDSLNTGLAKSMESFVAVGLKLWQRTDRAILWLRGPLIVRLELPAARRHEEQLKLRKGQKAHASVPKL